MKLCFGVFATILKHCLVLSQEELVTKLVKCVDKNSSYIATEYRYKDINNERIEGDAPAISKLINCKKNFYFSKGNDTEIPKLNTVIKNLDICLIPSINVKKKEKIILALVKVIQLDESIDNEEKEIFREVFGVNKKLFLEQPEYVFLDILGKALLYTVNSEIENTKGKDCIKTITEKFVEDQFSASCCDYEWDSDKGLLKLSRHSKYMVDDTSNVKSEDNLSKELKEKHSDYTVLNISDEFQKGIDDYNIKLFLESSPNNFPYSSIVEDALSFANHIDSINNTHECSDIESDIYNKIIKFNDILFEYLNFLKCNAAEVANFPLFFKLKSDDAIILDEAEKYLLQLKPMCQEIQAEIDIIYQDIHEKQVAELKEKDEEALKNRSSDLKRKS